MPIITEFEFGDTARFKARFKDNEGEIIEPDESGGDHEVSIQISELATDTVVEEEEMDELSDTEFKYDWQTTEDLNIGEYEVEVRGTFQNDVSLSRDRVRLVRTKTR